MSKKHNWDDGPFVNLEKYQKVKQRILEKFQQHDDSFIMIGRKLVWYTRFLIILSILTMTCLGIILYGLLT